MAAPGTLGPCLRRADSGAFLLNPTGGAQGGPTRGHSLEDRPPLTARRRPPRPLPSPRPLPKPRPLARPRGERRERAAARPLPFRVRRTVHLPRPGSDSSRRGTLPTFPWPLPGRAPPPLTSRRGSSRASRPSRGRVTAVRVRRGAVRARPRAVPPRPSAASNARAWRGVRSPDVGFPFWVPEATGRRWAAGLRPALPEGTRQLDWKGRARPGGCTGARPASLQPGARGDAAGRCACRAPALEDALRV